MTENQLEVTDRKSTTLALRKNINLDCPFKKSNENLYLATPIQFLKK